MPIKHIISMFEQKIAKSFEEIVLLKGNKAIYICLNTRLCNENGWFIRVFFYILINYLGRNNKKVLIKQNMW